MLPEMTPAQYQAVVEKVTSELLDKSEAFRKTIVYREMSALAGKWAAFIGIGNVIALVGIYAAVSTSMQQTITDKATKAVTEHNEAVDKSIQALTISAINQVSDMKSKLDAAQKTLDAGNERVAAMQRLLASAQEAANKLTTKVDIMQKDLDATRTTFDKGKLDAQAALLRAEEVNKASVRLESAWKRITDKRAFFTDPKNIDTLAEFAKIISEHKSTQVLADLNRDVRDLSTIVRDWLRHPNEPSVQSSLVDQASSLIDKIPYLKK
jgi:hypothetical protein